MSRLAWQQAASFLQGLFSVSSLQKTNSTEINPKEDRKKEIKAPGDAIIRTASSPIELLEREKYLYEYWVKSGHNRGVNTHSISVTVSYSNLKEYEEVIGWMWDNREHYAGISLLEVDNSVYPQLPFESISEDEYYERLSLLGDIYLDSIIEGEDNTDLSGEAACAGGSCSIQ